MSLTKQSYLVPTYAQLPLTLVRGDGAIVWDDQGKRYWDFYGGHAVALLGHSHSAVADAIAAQARALTFYSNIVPIPIRDQAAETLALFAPLPLRHVFFCNSGAEANENALKLAIQQTGRKRIAALVGAFHGRTLLALAATDTPALKKSLDGLLCPTLRISPNEITAIAQIDESIAAVIVEPILSMAGVIELSPDFLHALRQRCDQVGAFLIYDEVQTGLGRLGRPFAAGEDGVIPDMVTLAKGLGNGIPVGAVLLHDRVATRVQINDLGTTFGGNPLAAAAILATMGTLEDEKLVDRARQLGARMHERLAVGPVKSVIGRGCLIGLRVTDDAKRLHNQLLARGFITGTSGDPRVLRLLPPLTLPFVAIDELHETLQEIGATADAALAGTG